MGNGKQTKYIFVTGGVVSSLGKGIAAASFAALMEARGLKVSMQKLDPYINVDPGTMSPLQHGEVFVTDDGCETDLDLGHYERFTGRPTSRRSNYTTGQIYKTVLDREREGRYLGVTVQVIPHITDTIKEMIHGAHADSDIGIVEIGGTVGDIESQPFLEAIRQMRFDLGPDNVFYVHVTYVPYLKVAGEVKTKPTQHSVRELRAIGIQPDLLVCRSEVHIDHDTRRKISRFCDVAPEAVLSGEDLDSIYKVPLNFHNQRADAYVAKLLKLDSREPDLRAWQNLCTRLDAPKQTVSIAVVGKYTDLEESYKSLHESLLHAGLANDVKVKIRYVEAEGLTSGETLPLDEIDGILVPGGFGERGVEGKIEAIRLARTSQLPFFGICLGMQCAVIEYARNVVGISDAHSAEFKPDGANSLIHYMMEQRSITAKGGTMRLGGYPCVIRKGSLAHKLYGSLEIRERHRHRLEVNNQYRTQLEAKGLVLSGLSPSGDLVEIVELPSEVHPWFIGCQFHPEFLSTPFRPHPIFHGFIAAARARANAKVRAA